MFRLNLRALKYTSQKISCEWVYRVAYCLAVRFRSYVRLKISILHVAKRPRSRCYCEMCKLSFPFTDCMRFETACRCHGFRSYRAMLLYIRGNLEPEGLSVSAFSEVWRSGGEVYVILCFSCQAKLLCVEISFIDIAFWFNETYLCVILFRFAIMENDAGEFVDLYCPRKW